MNVFTDYTPVFSWRNHDTGTKRTILKARRDFPASALIAIPDRANINTVKTLPKDKTDMIRRGGR